LVRAQEGEQNPDQKWSGFFVFGNEYLKRLTVNQSPDSYRDWFEPKRGRKLKKEVIFDLFFYFYRFAKPYWH
jgi:hypothetical protein